MEIIYIYKIFVKWHLVFIHISREKCKIKSSNLQTFGNRWSMIGVMCHPVIGITTFRPKAKMTSYITKVMHQNDYEHNRFIMMLLIDTKLRENGTRTHSIRVYAINTWFDFQLVFDAFRLVIKLYFYYANRNGRKTTSHIYSAADIDTNLYFRLRSNGLFISF